MQEQEKYQTPTKRLGIFSRTEKELTDIEKQLIYLTGEIAIEGIHGVPEIGIEIILKLKQLWNIMGNIIKQLCSKIL